MPHRSPKGFRNAPPSFVSLRVSFLLIVLVFLAAPALAQKRNITEKDLFNLVWIGDPQVSPDGSRIAFVRVTLNAKKDGYSAAIWTVSTAAGETRQLTSGPRDSCLWSPHGKFLVFMCAPEKDGRIEPAQLFILAMSGGETSSKVCDDICDSR